MFLQVLSRGLTLLDHAVHDALLTLWYPVRASHSSSSLSSCPPHLPPIPPQERQVLRMCPEVGALFEYSSPTSRGQWWDFCFLTTQQYLSEDTFYTQKIRLLCYDNTLTTNPWYHYCCLSLVQYSCNNHRGKSNVTKILWYTFPK